MGVRRASFDRCFELEVLEPRVMLSGDGMAAPMGGVDTGPRIELAAGQELATSTTTTDSGSMKELAAALMAAQANWINPAGGAWTDAANWEDGHIPVAGDEVTITGLNSDATLTLAGATPELASLTIDSGTLEISGSVFTEDLTLSGSSRLVINGEATSAITGEVTIAADARMTVQGSSTVSWSGSVWALAGELTFNSGTSFSQSAGRVEINTGGLFQVMEGASSTSRDWSDLFVQGGTLRVDGSVAGTGNVEIIQYAGLLTGAGTLSNEREILLHGEVNPGSGEGTTGTLTIDADAVFRKADGSDTDWSIKLDIADADNADRLVITGSAELNADGAISLSAASADFGASTTGTLIDTDGRLITVGSTVSTPTIQVTPGPHDTVVGNWDQANGRLVVETYSPINATWTNAAGGDWSDAANWTNGRLPTAGESVSLTGLNSDAVVTLNGDTPVLTELSLDGGTLAIAGGLNTGDLTVTGSAVLTIEGAATSAITGDVSFATGTSFTVKSGGDLTWSGATWTQGGFAQIAAGGAFTQTAGRLEISASEQFAVNGTLNLNGGEFVVPAAGSALNLYNSGQLNVTGATLTLSGGTVSAYNETIVIFTNGVLSGAGTFKVNHLLNFAGNSVIKVGGAGTTGTLNFTQGEDATDGAISFADAWAIQLDVLSSSSYDVLSFDSSVTFGASGAIAINAASADFTGLDEGTALGDALTVNGAVTGTPTVNVTAGETFSVNTIWSGTALAMTTVGSGVVDSGGSTVAAGITAATSTMQGMLSGFNLGTINFAGQGRTAFALPTLPSALADLFSLSGAASLLDLPGIGSASTTPEAISALENAGYTVTTPGGGVDLLASLTRTVSTDLAPSGTNFTAPAQFLAGIADTLNITAAFSLTASLIQHVVFELRDGVFNLLPDTYLALALAGGATLAGNVRQGDRTVSVTGSTTFTDAEVRVINASGGATATATGVIGVSLTLEADPVTLTYQQDSTLTGTTDSLTTSVTSTSTLSGTLELPAVKDSEGHAAVFALTGTVAGDGQSWTLTGSGSNVEWLAFNVSEWSFDVSLNAGTFSGSGSFTTALDFLSNSGAAPEVALSASFNQDTVSFTGTLNAAEIAVTNPAGGTYLSIADFSSTTSVSANLSTGEWTGTLTFNGGESSFAPAGAAFTATITDGDDEDAYAVMGSYDFSSQAFSTSVDQFAIVAENIVSVVSAGVSLRHQRNVTEDQELVTIEHVAVSLLFLKNQPSTGPPSAEAASISIRTNGITIGAGSLTTETLNLGSVLSASQVEVAFTEFAFLDGTLATDRVTFSAESATLFPEGDTFTASATNLSGTYDFNEPTDRLALSAGALSFEIDGLVNFSASDVTLRPEGDTIFSAATMSANLPAFGVSGEISGLEISSTGTASATAFSIDTSGITEKLGLGGVLPFGIDGIAVKFHGDTNDNGIRDEGEVFRLDSFDLTVNGHFDFAVMASLPFTPIIKVGETEFDDAGDSLSLEVRVVAGSPQIWNTPTITLGIADLKIGNVVKLGGSVTLGGYTDGVWGGTFGGSITMTSLNENVTASASATVSGMVDVDAKQVSVNTEATLDLGIADTITLSDATLTLNFTITDAGDSGLALAVSEATASVGMLKVGTIFEASEVTATMTDLTVSSSGVALGSLSLSAATATLLPEAEGVMATTTGFSGSYDFTTDPDTFELTAESVNFALAGVMSLEATEVSLTPTGETVFSVTSVSATLDGFDSSATVTDFEVARDGTPTAGAVAINTEGLADSLGLGGVLPFNIAGISVAAPEEGGRISFRDFDLSVNGTFDFEALGVLPFTPIIRIGAQEADDGSDSFSFTVRMQEGVLTPWDLGPIELGVTNLKMGDALNFGGTIRLGGYAEGAWVPAVGGTLTLGATATTKNLSGEVTVAIDGSWTESTGVLNLTASFTVSFQMGDYVEVTDANIGLNLSLTTRGAEGAFQLGVGQFAVEKASIASVTVTFGSVLSMSATDATFDFAATGSAELLSVGSLQATLTGLGIGGEARNFAIGADGSLQLGDEFGVSLQLGEGGTSTIKWPSWIPLQVTLFDIQWKNLNEDPLNFTLRVSGSVSTEGLSGSKLTLAGSVSNLIIDVGLLKAGAFPIIGLGDVGIAVGGKIAGSKVAAALLLGVLRVDEAGNVIGDADIKTEVAQRVLWGAVQGAIDIAGYGGFEIYLGISQYGPLQGFVKASAPVLVDVTGLTGLALTGFRGGITFNSELPAISDPKGLGDSAEFKPTATLTFGEWRDLMLNSLAKQVGSASEGGLLAILQNPFRIEGGVTVFSLYASKATFNVDGDFIMDSTGKFLVRGAFEIGGSISFTANLYVDISRFVTEGNATILFFAELPSEFPIATLYGSLIFDFGVTIDPDNPPSAPFEQFTIKITGGIELGIDGLPKATVDGEANLEVALNAPSLHVTLTGKASIEKLGDLIGVAGDLKFFFGADKTVQAVGIIAMTPADLAQLSSLGLTLDGIALLRFNTTAEAVDYTLTIPGQSAPRNFTVNAGEASVQLEGVAGLAPAGQELFRLQGVLSMSLSTAGWDVLVDAVLTAGAQAAPLLKFEAQGYLKLVLDGINVGMAAKMKLSLDTDDDALARAGLQLDGSYEFLMNTTGQDVNYSLPSELAEKSEIKLIHLPRGPPVAEGEPAREAGNYLIVRAEGSLSLDGGIAMAGTFDFTVADGLVQMDYHATIALKSGETTFLSLAGDGHWIISSEGVAGTSTLELDGSTGIPSMSLGFSFEATFALQINTTGSAQTVGETQLEAGRYARLRASGDLMVGLMKLTGTYDLKVGVEGVEATAAGSVSLGVGATTFASFSFEGIFNLTENGIFTSLSLTADQSGRDSFGFGFKDGATYTLSINTTANEIEGVPAGLGAVIKVEGSLQIGEWDIAGVYTFTVGTTGLGFAASAALAFRAGENTLFEIPINFEIEMTLPGIVKEFELAVSLDDIAAKIPGLELGLGQSGSAKLVINTTAQAQGDIPAGPMLALTVTGYAQIQDIKLEGTFSFTSTLNSVTMHADFEINLGDSFAPFLTFSGTADFDLNLFGIAGVAGLKIKDGSIPLLNDLFATDASIRLELNSRATDQEIAGKVLAANSAKLAATGSMTILGLTFEGEYLFTSDSEAVSVTMNADLDIVLPSIGGSEEVTLLKLNAKGVLHANSAGLVAAFDVTPETADFSKVGLNLDTDVSFKIRINTTGAMQTVGLVDLEAGRYARVNFDSSLDFDVFRLEGHFALAIVDSTAELTVDASLIAALPSIPGVADGLELFRMGAKGGVRISSQGAAAAIVLDRGGLDKLKFFDIEIPFGASQEFRMELNTTGREAVLGGVTMEAGRYLRIATQGGIDLGLVRFEGNYQFVAGEKGLEIAVNGDVFLGVPGTEISLFRWSAAGGLSVKANGVAALVELSTAQGLDGLDAIGLKMDTVGVAADRHLRMNTTGESVTLGESTLEAGHYIEVATNDSFSIGVATLSGGVSFRLGDDGLEMNVNGRFFFGLPSVGGLPQFNLMESQINTRLRITGEGVYGRALVTQERDSITLAGVNFLPKVGGTSVLALNTTGESKTVDGNVIAAGSVTLGMNLGFNFLDQNFNGTAVVSGNIDRGFLSLYFTGGVDVGISDWRPFQFETEGYLVLGRAGAATNLNLTLKSGGISGLDLSGDWSLRASTMSEAVTIPAFAAGGVTVPEIVVEAGNLMRVKLDGTLSVGGLNLAGTFDLAASGAEFAVTADASVSFFGVTAAVDGLIYLHRDRGFVANVGLSWGGIDNSLMRVSGSARLQINTWSGVWEEVNPNTVSVTVSDATLGLLGFNLTGSMAFVWQDGVATLRADNLTLTPVSGLTTVVSGQVDSAGNFDFTGTSTITLGDTNFVGISGSLATRFNNSGFSGELDGRIDLLGIDHTTVKGSVSVDGESLAMSLDMGRVKLLGDALILSGRIEAYRVSDGRVGFNVSESNPLKLEVLGGAIEATVSGYIWSDGKVNLNGSATLNIGDANFVKLSGALDVHVSNSGFSATLDGRIDLLGLDYTTVKGSVAIDGERMAMSLDMGRVKLLGDALIISGRIEAYRESDGRVGFNVSESNPLKLEVLGNAIEATVSGYIWSDGKVNLNGSATLNIGDPNFVKLSGALDVQVSNDGFSATLDGRIDLLGGDYSSVKGSVVIDDSGLALSLDMGRVKLLGDALIISGRIEAYMQDGRVGFNVSKSNPLKLEVLGGAIEATVWGYIWSDGKVNLNGTAMLDIGDANFVKLSGALDVHVSNSGFSAALDGRIDLLGIDYTYVKGSVAINGGELAMSLEMRRVKLLGNALIISGRIDAYRRANGDVGFTVAESNPLKVELGPKVAVLTGWGSISSDGTVDLNASGNLDIGSKSAMAVIGSLNLKISRHAIGGNLNAALWIANDNTNAFTVDVFIDLNRGEFTFFHSGKVRVLGIVISTGTTVTVGPDGVSASISATADILGKHYNLSGRFNTSGSWSFSGRSSGWIGVKHIADARYYTYFEFNDQGGSFSIWGTMWIFGQGRDFSASVDLTNRTAAFRAGSIWGTVYFDSGVIKPWASRLENATVFFDANLNGVLDDGEPVGTQLADGSFDFGNSDTATRGDSDDLGALATYDGDHNNRISSAELKVILAGQSKETDFEGLGTYVSFDQDNDGVFDGPEAQALAGFLGLDSTDTSSLGLLAPYDTNGDLRITNDEIAVYAVNGISDNGGTSPLRFYVDANGDGRYTTGELSADLSSAVVDEFYQNPTSIPAGMERFDTDGNGKFEASELGALSTQNLGARVPLTRLTSGVSGTVTVDDADFVFADVNGNGVYDVDEPRVTPTTDGRYFFNTADAEDASRDSEQRSLGRLAPYDRNGNGRIDADEGVFVITGGHDADSGVANTMTMRATAGDFGGSSAQVISPLTTLKAALVKKGMTEDEAETLIEDMLDLPASADLDTYSPVEADNVVDRVSQQSALVAGAKVLTLMSGGASLLGDDANTEYQAHVLNSLAAEMLERRNQSGGDTLNLSDAGLINEVLADAGTLSGRAIDEAHLTAVTGILKSMTDNIDEAGEEAGDVSRNLAADKAVLLTAVSSGIEQLVSGGISSADLSLMFSDENLDRLADAVVLSPTVNPTLHFIPDLTVQGGDRVSVNLSMSDADTALENLILSVTSSDGGVVDSSAVSFHLINGEWEMLVPVSYVELGQTTLVVTVSDGVTSSRRSFDLTVSGFNPVIRQIDQVADQTLIAGDLVSLDLTSYFADADGNATYTVSPVGSGETAVAAIMDGHLVVTASESLSGVEIFDLVARDGSATFTQRFSVITYPTIRVAENVSYDANGRTVVAVTLSNPSNQPLELNYRSGSSTGTVTFAAGEVTQFIPISLSNDQVSGSTPGELQVGLTGDWVSGQFEVGLDTFSAVELMGLRRDIAMSVQFTLSYLFVDPETSEEDEVLLTPLATVVGPDGQPLVVAVKVTPDSNENPTGGSEDLGGETSLESWSQPRQMQGI